MSGLSEFDLIDELLKPLAQDAPEAFALSDDAAMLPRLDEGQVHVVTKDALAVGVHMLPDDPPGDMARKALRVNLSDLAAMGATPVGVFMALCLSEDTDENFVRAFVAGLAEDLTHFSVPLMGGDIVRHPGPFLLTITAVGRVKKDQVLRRSGANPGDGLWVSGRIGDGALGLLAAKGELPGASAGDTAYLIDRYRKPQPRIVLGEALTGLANACIDISDGLVADVGHMCAASKLGCEIQADAVPLSGSCRSSLDQNPLLLDVVLSGGDDYELAFALSSTDEAKVHELANTQKTPLTRVGTFQAGQGVEVVGADGVTIAIAQTGYRHI